MKILCIGSQGQVARSLSERAHSADIDLYAHGRTILNILDGRSIKANIAEVRPNIIVNTAAYTAVDLAESEPEQAFALNAKALEELAKLAAESNTPVVHLSTDYVFDGAYSKAYTEDMDKAPMGVYGETKLAGEIALEQNQPQHIVLRTAWIYGPYGKNFVKTMLRLASERDEIPIVADQFGNPTSSIDIADAVLAIAKSVHLQKIAEPWGIYHMVGSGATTWAGLAEQVFAISARLGGPTARVNKITSRDYPTPAKRPENSQLDCSKLSRIFDIELPFWESSLESTVERLLR
ncbi:MAG: dTDP-4-dehydrorhamnose reductase [Pseudomonadota bacterium]